MNHLFKRFKRDIIGLIWMATAIFLGLALLSFDPSDPSLNSVASGLKARNYCGYFGSFMADLLYQGLGLSAWVLVLGAARLCWFAFSGREIQFQSLRWLWSVLLLASTASLASVYFPEISFYAGSIRVGGVVGDVLGRTLVAVFNFPGAVIILWTCVVALVVFYTETSLRDMIRWPMDLLRSERLREIVEGIGLYTLDFFELAKEKGVEAAKKLKPQPAYSGAEAGEPKPAKPLFRLKQSNSEGTDASRFTPITDGDCLDEAYGEEEYDEEYGEEEDTEEYEAEEEIKTKKRLRKRRVSLRRKVQRRIENWELPKIGMLEDPPLSRYRVEEKEIKQKTRLLVNKLAQFSVRGNVINAKPGPAVTMFEFKPDVDVKISKITELADDLSLALSSESVRIIAPIPGRDVVGIETSNVHRETVYLKDILADDSFWDEEIKLPLALGCEADGTHKVVDLRKMPHMLVAGSTGSGKSVFVVSMLSGLLFRHSPKTLRLILVDPKQVDLAAFGKVPHLLMPPLREAKKAIGALRWAIREMDKRYRSMAKFGARGLESYNEKVEILSNKEIEEHERLVEEMEAAKKQETYYFTPQPYIVVVVEEFGDLMAVDKSNVEQCVVRLAQMARACGIHLILAMQSPRKDVVTGLIKTNIPGRCSFKVASKMDSRIILDESGAERLLSRGDMLFLAPGFSKPGRHHGPWVTDEEINSVTEFWQDQAEPEYDPLAMRAIEGNGGGFDLPGGGEGHSDEEGYDERYDEVVAYVSGQKAVSASLLQRKFRLGYPRAARIIELLESEGVVGPSNGSKPRQVLINELK